MFQMTLKAINFFSFFSYGGSWKENSSTFFRAWWLVLSGWTFSLLIYIETRIQRKPGIFYNFIRKLWQFPVQISNMLKKILFSRNISRIFSQHGKKSALHYLWNPKQGSNSQTLDIPYLNSKDSLRSKRKKKQKRNNFLKKVQHSRTFSKICSPVS